MTDIESERKDLDRITMFNDAVFAIVLTILILEIHLQTLRNSNSSAEMCAELWHLAPKIFAFLLTAVVISGNWISRFYVGRLVIRSTRAHMIYIMVYLILISILPFSCLLIGEYPDNPISFVSFGVVTSLVAICGYFHLRYLRKTKLLQANTDFPSLDKAINEIPFLIFFGLVMSLSAFWSTKLSFVLFLLFNLLPFFVSSKFKVLKTEKHLEEQVK